MGFSLDISLPTNYTLSIHAKGAVPVMQFASRNNSMMMAMMRMCSMCMMSHARNTASPAI